MYGRFGRGEVCQLGYDFILAWIKEFMILSLGNKIQEKVEDDASVI